MQRGENPEPEGSSRRAFLQQVSAALGGVVLAGPVLSAEDASAPAPGSSTLATLPGAFRFHRIFTPGSQAYGLRQVTKLLHRVMIDDRNGVWFTAQNSLQEHGKGLYRLEIRSDLSGVTSAAAVFEAGAHLKGFGEVSHLESLDVCRTGKSAAVVHSEEAGVFSAIWGGAADRLHRLVSTGEPIAHREGWLSSHFAHVDITAGGSVFFVAHYHPPEEKPGRPAPSGLFFKERGSGRPPVLLWDTRDRIPRLRYTATALGQFHAQDDGHWVLQLHVHGAIPPPELIGIDAPVTALIAGRVDRPHQARLICASPGLRPPAGIPVGESHAHARIHHGGEVVHVVHHDKHNHSIHHRGRRHHGSGQRHSGAAVESVTPGVTSSRGLVYYTLVLDDARTELIVSNGLRHRTILRTGDTIGARTVATIVQGLHPSQANSAEQLVFLVRFDDRTESIIAAHPA
jgi:hypothetical protein